MHCLSIGMGFMQVCFAPVDGTRGKATNFHSKCQGKVLNEAVSLTHLFWVSVLVWKTVIALSITEHKCAGAALFCCIKFEKYSASLTLKYGIMVLLRVDSYTVPYFCNRAFKLHYVTWQQRQEILVINQVLGLSFLFYKCMAVTWPFLLLFLLLLEFHAHSWIATVSCTVAGVDNTGGANWVLELAPTYNSIKRKEAEGADHYCPKLVT